MTPETLVRRHLSMRHWLVRIVLPMMLVLLVTLYLFSSISDTARFRDHNATIVGFFAFYYVLIRGGHIVMIRSLHGELMSKYEEAYRTELAKLSPAILKRKKIGFTLAQIKRRIIENANKRSDWRKRS